MSRNALGDPEQQSATVFGRDAIRTISAAIAGAEAEAKPDAPTQELIDLMAGRITVDGKPAVVKPEAPPAPHKTLPQQAREVVVPILRGDYDGQNGSTAAIKAVVDLANQRAAAMVRKAAELLNQRIPYHPPGAARTELIERRDEFVKLAGRVEKGQEP